MQGNHQAGFGSILSFHHAGTFVAVTTRLPEAVSESLTVAIVETLAVLAC